MKKDRSQFRDRGTGSIFRRGKVLWIRYYRNGVGYSESTHSDNMTKAKAMLKARLAQIETGTFNPQQGKVRVSDLMETTLKRYEIDALKSIDDAKARWKLHLAPEFENLLAANVTSDMLESYVQKRLQQGAEPATVNRELALLKRGFTLGMESTPPKVRLMPKFPHLKEDNIRTGYVTEAQAERIYIECRKIGLWMSAMVWTLFEFGFRVSEAQNLRVSQVDLVNRSIDLNPGETKSGRGRTAIMTNRVYELLKACVTGKERDDYVFTRKNGGPVRDFRGTWYKVCTAVGLGKMICKRCNQAVTVARECSTCGKLNVHQVRYEGLIVHDLRRSAIRRMVRRGISEKTAMLISGHRTRSVFDRYDITSESDLRAAAAKLDSSLDTVEIQFARPATVALSN